MVIATLIANLEVNISQFDKDLTKAIGKANKFSGGLKDVGKTLTFGLTVPLVAFGTAAFAASTSFETAMAGVRKTVNASAPEIARLAATFTDLSERIPVSASKLAEIGQVAGQLGIQTKNIAKFVEVMAALGVSTNLSAEEAASGLARLANITGTSQNDFDRMGSTLVALGNNLATTEAEVLNMSLRIAGAGKTVGLTTSQVLGFAGALSSLGVRAESGGSAISRVMIEMSDAASTGGKKLDEFARVAGVSSEEFSRSFQKDATGAVLAFLEGLGRMNEEGANTFETLRILGLNNIRVRDIVLRGANAQDKMRLALELSNRAWITNTALARESSIFYDTNANKLQILINKVTNVARAFGDGLAPVLISVLQAALPVLTILQDIGIGFASLPAPIRFLIIAVFALNAAFGPLIFTLGVLITSLEVIGAFILGAGASGGLIALFGALGVVIAIFGGIILGIVGHFKKAKTGTEDLNSAFNKVPTAADNAANTINGLKDSLVDLKKGLFDANGEMDKFSNPAFLRGANIDKFLGSGLFDPKNFPHGDKPGFSGTAPTEAELKRTADIQAIWDKLSKTLVQSEVTFQLLGGTWNRLEPTLDAAKSTLQDLLDEGVNPMSPAVQGLVGHIRELQREFDFLERSIPVKEFKDFFQNQIDAFGKTAHGDLVFNLVPTGTEGQQADSAIKFAEKNRIVIESWFKTHPIKIPASLAILINDDPLNQAPKRTALQKAGSLAGGVLDVFKSAGSSILKVLSKFNPWAIIIEALGNALGDFLTNMTPIIDVLGKALMPILKALFPILKLSIISFTYFAQVIFKISDALLHAVGFLVKGLGKFLDAIPFLGDFGLIKAGQALIDLGTGFGQSADELAKSRDEIRKMEWKDALDPLKTAAEETAEALSNVPEVFKLASRVAQSSDPEGFLGGGLPGAVEAAQGRHSPIQVMGNVIVQSPDPDRAWEALQKGAREAYRTGRIMALPPGLEA